MMQKRISRLCALIMCCFCLISAIPIGAQAAYPIRRPAPDQENDPTDPAAAQNISDKALIANQTGFDSLDFLFDGGKYLGRTTEENASLTLSHPDGIGSLYFIFLKEYGNYTVINNDTGDRIICGTNNFLHEVIDLQTLFGGPATSVTVDFSNGPVGICELYVYTPGYLPAYVQQWEPAKEDKTDLILFSTHGDDDQLYFAGVLPYYTALDYEVLVVYLTDHRNNVQNRIHEMLNGLWAVGVTTYPVFGPFPDFFCKNLAVAYTKFEQLGTSRDDIIGFITEQLRRYQPQVVLGHDFGGEYKHGQHMAYADCLAAALEASPDPICFPDSATSLGTWDVPKAYFHLYEENKITMDWDTPMEELNGMTPFEVTQLLGYPQHRSQSNSGVSLWINGDGFSISKASQILTFSPCEFGLYQTNVGADIQKNDFFENLISYAEQDRIAEAQRQEEERLQAEEEARQQEEARRQEEARLAEEARFAEEKARAAEEARLASETLRAKKETQRNILIISVVALLILISIVIQTFRKRKY